jgi:Capsule assembly protein Wzi
LVCVLWLLSAAPTMQAVGQTSGVLQIDDGIHRFLVRQHLAGRLPGAHLSHQPLSAADGHSYLDSLQVIRRDLSETDRILLDRFRRVIPGPGVAAVRARIPRVYSNGHDLIGASSEDWSISVNPLFVGSYGKGKRTAGDGVDTEPTVWQNTRGMHIAGTVGPWFFFEGRFTENSQRSVNPNLGFGTAPRLGYVQVGTNSYSWMDAVGVVGLRSKYLEARFGRDRYRWGNGLSSPFLSNFAPAYDHLLLKARLWRFEYVSLFSAYASSPAEGAGRGDAVRRRKYGSSHRLAVHLPGNVEVSVFETVVFATDSLEVRERFDLSYANPVIFLRAVERDRGSPDNVLLGGSVAWRPLKGTRVFVELLLDEFKSDFVGKAWWANKWVWNYGLQVADYPVSGLTVRVEAARLRPFVYHHDDEIDAYVHFRDILGHPAGPNAWDYTFAVDYQASPRLRFSTQTAVTRRGRNANGINYGSDPLLDYSTGRNGDFGHTILQGVRQTQILSESFASYEVLPTLFADFAVRFESLDDAELGLDRWVTPFFQLRWGVPFPSVRW